MAVNQQRLIIDPSASPLVLMNRTPDGTYGVPSVFLTGHSFPAPQARRLSASAFETEGEQLGSEEHWEPRSIPLAFDVYGTSDTDIRDRMRAVDQKVAKLARRGGELQWRHPFGNTITFDVTQVDTYEPTYDERFYSNYFVPVSLTLSARPFGRGVETLLGTWTETVYPSVVATVSGVLGDVPALGRIEVQTPQQTGGGEITTLYYGLDSDSMGTYTVGNGVTVFLGTQGHIFNGASAAATNSTLGSALSYAIPSGSAVDYALITLRQGGSTEYLTQQGTFRLFARARVSSGLSGQLRARYWPNGYDGTPGGAGSSLIDPGYQTNAWSDYIVASTTSWSVVDLGLVTLDYRTNRRGGTIAIYAKGQGSTVQLDTAWLMPIERYAVMSIPFYAARSGNLAAVSDNEAYFSDSVDATHWPPMLFQGDYFKLPPGGTTRLVAYASAQSLMLQGDAEDNVQDQTLRVYATPRYLNVPD